MVFASADTVSEFYVGKNEIDIGEPPLLFPFQYSFIAIQAVIIGDTKRAGSAGLSSRPVSEIVPRGFDRCTDRSKRFLAHGCADPTVAKLSLEPVVYYSSWQHHFSTPDALKDIVECLGLLQPGK